MDQSTNPQLPIAHAGSEAESTKRELALMMMASYLRAKGFEDFSLREFVPRLEEMLDNANERGNIPGGIIDFLEEEIELDKSMGRFYPQKAYLGGKLDRFKNQQATRVARSA